MTQAQWADATEAFYKWEEETGRASVGIGMSDYDRILWCQGYTEAMRLTKEKLCSCQT